MKIVFRLLANLISLGIVLFGLAGILAGETAFGIWTIAIGLICLTLATKYISIPRGQESKGYKFLRLTEAYIYAGLFGVICGAVMTYIAGQFIRDQYWLNAYMVFVVNMSIIAAVSFGYYLENRKTDGR